MNIPICLACAYGAAKQRNHRSKTNKLGNTAKDPGDFVSVDTMEAGTPGFIPFTKGRRSTRRYTNTTIWVDKISKYIHNWEVYN